MPRMNLTEQEAEIILKKREDERFYNAGWNGALKQAQEVFRQSATTQSFRAEQIIELLEIEKMIRP